METDAIPLTAPSDWQPITDKHDLAVIGKLGEEACELGAALFRCVIQGLDEAEPKTGKINRDWVQDEIADVLALAGLAIDRLGLDYVKILERSAKKKGFKEPWFEGLKREREVKS